MKKALLALSILALVGVAPRMAKAQIVQIDGSSTVFPVTEAVAEEFQKAKKARSKSP
jgi:phosphate transport system substrate-binding protein